MDEPTIGLHMSDIDNFFKIIKALVKNDNTVIIIEHNLDTIKFADWIIDLGPEGGKKGGELIFQGLPEAKKALYEICEFVRLNTAGN